MALSAHLRLIPIGDRDIPVGIHLVVMTLASRLRLKIRTS